MIGLVDMIDVLIGLVPCFGAVLVCGGHRPLHAVHAYRLSLLSADVSQSTAACERPGRREKMLFATNAREAWGAEAGRCVTCTTWRPCGTFFEIDVRPAGLTCFSLGEQHTAVADMSAKTTW